ncbi:MAG TPA: hypothetical protein VEL76_43210 [Gemmataceae bacterium]|nr:hypothetical protein [Gemmataceae bacterium]
MSQRSSQREPQRNSNGRAPAANQLDPWQDDDALHREMQRLSAENKQLLAQTHPEHAEGDAAEVEQLRGENAELRRRVDELDNALLERSEGEEDWTERQKEYEALLEEKSEVIRSLHQKIQELRESAVPAPAQPEERSSSPMDPAAHEDLLMMKRRLEEDRAQLEEDEEALEQQMRQMEMVMSKERAEMARQRAELQRLHNDLRHEMELAARDAALRERLQPLQRRQQEVSGRKGNASESAGSEPPRKNTSGIFRRFFGTKEE